MIGLRYVFIWIMAITGFAGCAEFTAASDQPTGQTEINRAFINGIASYQAGDYKTAIVQFGHIADSGVRNGKLFYNLGNAYFKHDDLGRAILWYERAAAMLPEDPDLKFNLEYARSMTKDDSEIEPGLSILQIFFFWKHLLNAPLIKLGGIFFSTVFWIGLILQRLRFKFISRWLLFLTAVISTIFILTSLYTFYQDAYAKGGIIIQPEVSVRSGLSDEATVLFTLHAGTRVGIDMQKGAYFRITFTSDKTGWIKKDMVGII